MRYLGLIWLTACGAIDVGVETTPCENVELDAEPTVMTERDGDDVRIFRMPVFVGDVDVFTPELSFEGSTIFIRENWTESEDSTADVCRSPTVRLLDVPSRTFTIEWYLDESVIPDYRFKLNTSDM